MSVVSVAVGLTIYVGLMAALAAIFWYLWRWPK